MTFICTNPDEEAYDEALRQVGAEAEAADDNGEVWTHADARRAFDRMSDAVEEWQGIPTPLPELPLHLHDRHPLARFYMTYDATVNRMRAEGETYSHSCSTTDVDDTEIIRHAWYSRRLNATIFVVQKQGRVFHLKAHHAPDRSMDRLTLWLATIGASDAWDMDAEMTARMKLADLVTERQYRHYDLTGAFFETSVRSRLTYVLRRLRPTIALSPRGRDGVETNMRCVACLCMHPIGYYGRSWGGCLVPTDDVIAHLLWIRSDEAGYWGTCNQHQPWEPEAGL
jgi:hypothetical protein